MFNPQAYENSRPDGIPVLEIVDHEKETDEPQTRPFVPLKRTELKGEVIGPLAALRLVQTFGFTHEQGDKIVEALYRFPLPGDAAVTSVRVRFGQVDIRADLKERSQAETDYAEAKQQGRQAALVTRESPDVFTLQIAGIQPDQDITVETYYVQQARAEGGGWSVRIPLTTSPRYVRSDELTSRHAQGQPLFLLRDPGHRFALDLTFRGAGAVTSSTHRLDVTHDGECQRVQLHGGEVLPDRDCVLSWKPTQTSDRPALSVQLHLDPQTQQVYFLALVAPPATYDRGRGVPREVTVLVDHSGSMEGAKWQVADWAVERFVADLTSRDVFSLGLFHNTTHWLASKPRAATPEAVANAVQFLRKNRDSGGTELGVALEQALDRKRADGEMARHVLLITDAEVTDAGRLLRLADAEAQRPDRRRISVLCIDAAPNSLLATELAERGGGISRFLTSQPDEEDITTALDEILTDWAEPVLTDLRLEVNRSQVEVAGRERLRVDEAGWSAVDLGDLPTGRPVWVAGRVRRGEGQDLAFRVRTAKGREVAAYRLDVQQPANARPVLKALFGARRVRGLETLIHSGYAGEELKDHLQRLGYDAGSILEGQPGRPTKVYAENVRADASAALRGLLVQEALDYYGLAIAETAFVAVRQEAGKPVEETVLVANALPSGWSGRFIGGAARKSLSGGFRGQAMFACAPAPPPTADKTLAQLSRAVFSAFSPDVGETAVSRAPSTVLFSDIPLFSGAETLLFDSSRDHARNPLPEEATINRLEVRFPDGLPQPGNLDAGLCLLIFVDDLASPRARVRLTDIVRQRGERPLNIRKLPGQSVRLVLIDPAGTWNRGVPRLEVALAWEAAR